MRSVSARKIYPKLDEGKGRIETVGIVRKKIILTLIEGRKIKKKPFI